MSHFLGMAAGGQGEGDSDSLDAPDAKEKVEVIVVDSEDDDDVKEEEDGDVIVIDDDDDVDEIVHVEDMPVGVVRPNFLHLGTIRANVVGLQYYDGIIHGGEYLTLVRQPDNPHDCNAIRVDNTCGEQVGHLKRDIAEVLAPILDNASVNGILVEATALWTSNGKYSIPCVLNFHGPIESFDGLREKVVSFQVKTAQYSVSRRATGGASAPGISGIEPPYVHRWKRPPKAKTEGELEKMFDGIKNSFMKSIKALRREDLTCVKTALLPHQRESVQWMVARERSPDGGGLPPFWEEKKELGRTVYYNTITCSSQPDPPRNVRGGILADDMGLGKTLSMLAVISNAKHRATSSSAPGRSTGPTLIICPVSVMYNWQSQVREHLEEWALKVLVWYGPKRTWSLDVIQSHDVVMTSYGMIVQEHAKELANNPPDDSGPQKSNPPRRFSEVKKAKARKRQKTEEQVEAENEKTLFDVKWDRIVLDEAHSIRNRFTKTFKACTALKASMKWCLTGTPFVNRPSDIQSLLEFLKCSPVEQLRVWNNAIELPIQNGEMIGITRLRLLVSALCMRRTKALLADRLPSKEVETQELRLSGEQMAIYDSFFRSSSIVVSNLGDQRILKNYSHLLVLILRLRQACCSGKLVEKHAIQFEELLEQCGSESMTPEVAEKLLHRMMSAFNAAGDKGKKQMDIGEEQVAECCVCLESQTSKGLRILKTCEHCLCGACLEKIYQTKPRCPLCRANFTIKDIYSVGKLQQKTTKIETGVKTEEGRSSPDEAGLEGDSVKIQAMMTNLRSCLEENPNEKFVVFSQFTSFLDIIEDRLTKCLGAVRSIFRLDGSMNANQRQENIEAFNRTTESCVFLVSLRSGGVGLNLNAACKGFIMDLWWAPSVEEQAMDRLHRIGQTRPVKIVRYVCNKTVETRLLEIQEMKNIFGKGTLQKISPEEMRRARLQMFKKIFSKDRHDTLEPWPAQQCCRQINESAAAP